MIEILQLIFSGWWTWLGTVVLVYIISHGCAVVLTAMREK